MLKPSRGAQLNQIHPLARGISGYWLFNEGCGSQVWDYSGNGNYGTLTNMDPSIDWVGGKYGHALNFDGINNYADIVNEPYFDDLFNGVNPLSIVFWSKGSIATQVCGLVIKGNDPFFGGVYLSEGTGGFTGNDIFFEFKNGSNANKLSLRVTNGYVQNVWQNWAFTYDGSQAASGTKIYLNGANQSFTTITNTLSGVINNALPLKIGTFGTSPNRYFNGLIEMVTIYKRVLSPKEVIGLYRNPFAMFEIPPRPSIFFVSGINFSILSEEAINSNIFGGLIIR